MQTDSQFVTRFAGATISLSCHLALLFTPTNGLIVFTTPSSTMTQLKSLMLVTPAMDILHITKFWILLPDQQSLDLAGSVLTTVKPIKPMLPTHGKSSRRMLPMSLLTTQPLILMTIGDLISNKASCAYNLPPEQNPFLKLKLYCTLHSYFNSNYLKILPF